MRHPDDPPRLKWLALNAMAVGLSLVFLPHIWISYLVGRVCDRLFGGGR